MGLNIKIDISVIVPIYNVEDYLPVCIDSLLKQEDIGLEIILIDDSSTDRSGTIADQYAQYDSRIRVIHQKNGGASSARNAGLKIAKGEYIAFVDSDDWVVENSLGKLFYAASKHQADIVMGKIWYCNSDRTKYSPFRNVPEEIKNITLHGKECFIGLVKFSAYPPMVYNYIYRRKYLENIQASFEEGIIYEDELWSPVVICQAERMLIADIVFYFYRQNDESVMNTTKVLHRLKSMFLVTDKLMRFSDRYDFSGNDAELKNWLYVIIFRLYSVAFYFLSQIKDPSYILPEHHLNRFLVEFGKMMPEPQKRCSIYFRKAENELIRYTDWVGVANYKAKSAEKSMFKDSTIENKVIVSPSQINLSIIIPLYNTEEYLPECLNSLLQQEGLTLEIIIVNDGSTDGSGEIAEEYAKRDGRITVINQKNGGASSARNTGFKLAQGEYIAFFDSDDWVKENSLYKLYHSATMHRADIAMGKIWFYYQNGSLDNCFRSAPEDLVNIPLNGKECFARLVQHHAHSPMAYNYIYRKEFLEKIDARFEEGIINEDALWSPIVMCQAERMLITGYEFYYHRQHEKSVMQTTGLVHRLKSMFLVTDQLIKFSDRFDFSGKDSELKNWLMVYISDLYVIAFKLLSRAKDTSIPMPEHHLDRFWKDCHVMAAVPGRICQKHFQEAELYLRKYISWRISKWVASIADQIKTGKKLMLIFNTICNKDFSINLNLVPVDWIITTDRRYFKQADVVIMYLPELYQEELENDLEKQERQIWASWYQNSKENDLLLNDPEIRNLFDLWICNKPDEEQKEHSLNGLFGTIDEMLNEKDKVLCPCCGKTFGRFIHFDFNRPYVYDLDRYTETYKNTVCPNCLSLPRHRIACHYFDKNCVEGNILMFGAEISIKNYFDRNHKNYITADLFDQTAYLKIDLQEIKFPDEQWNLIICNHILEHIPDYKKALNELRRILKKDGILEITVPTDRNLETIYEADGVSITSAEERIKEFGQYDHLRIFGNDFERILTDSGFYVEVVDGGNLLPEIVGVTGPADYDDNRVYICKKKIY